MENKEWPVGNRAAGARKNSRMTAVAAVMKIGKISNSLFLRMTIRELLNNNQLRSNRFIIFKFSSDLRLFSL